jgi:hypothetical protein
MTIVPGRARPLPKVGQVPAVAGTKKASHPVVPVCGQAFPQAIGD